MNLQGTPVTLHEMSLRDGMHARQHQFTLDEMVTIATEASATQGSENQPDVTSRPKKLNKASGTPRVSASHEGPAMPNPFSTALISPSEL